MESLRIYLRLIQISMKSRLQYRADFIIGMINVFILNAVNLALIGILVHRFKDLGGWSVWDMFFLYSMFLLGHSIYSLLFWHLNAIDDYIAKGTFDQFLVRPVSPLIQFLGREIQYIGLGDVVVGLITFLVAYVHESAHWGIGKWLYFVVAILSGTFIEMAIRWSIASTAFWLGRSASLSVIMNRFNLLVQQYPIDVFGNWFRFTVTLIPIAFMNYYPAIVLLGKASSWIWWLGVCTPVVAIVSLFLAWSIWRRGITAYTSSGS